MRSYFHQFGEPRGRFCKDARRAHIRYRRVIKPTHIRVSDLRGFHRLASDATVGLADLVEAMHHTIVRAPRILGNAPKGRTKGITGLVYRSVRGVTRLVGGGVDALLALIAPLLAEG